MAGVKLKTRCYTMLSRWKLKPVLITGGIIWATIYLYTVPSTTKFVTSVCQDTAIGAKDAREVTDDAATDLQLSHGQHQHSSYGHCQSDDFEHFRNVSKTSSKYFTDEYNVGEEPLKSWLSDRKTFCNKTVQVFGDKFGIVRDVLINPNMRVGATTLAKGGEEIQEVKSQDVKKEDYIFTKGFYNVACGNNIAEESETSNSQYDKLRLLKIVKEFGSNVTYKTEEKFTIAIARGDYANLWNHMFEVYGVFVLMMSFNKNPDDVNILFLDGHPSCLLDRNWEHIFGPVQRVGRFDSPVLYKNLVWGLAEKEIPLSKWQAPACPYVEEFRTFILNQYDIVENAKKLNCKRLTFTFIVRRNQVYHPRNLVGDVQRKMFNELEVIEILMMKFPGVCIQALLMESIPMRAQMEIISETDVLIGMHGAGMMHTTFLPRHAGVVELFPREWRKTRPFSVMYEKMTQKWRQMTYEYWQNPDPEREFSDKITIVDVEQVFTKVQAVIDRICKV